MQNEPVQNRHPGNICVSDRGNLFIFMGYTQGFVNEESRTFQRGMGFNGKTISTEKSEKLAENLDEYLLKTYGNNFSQEINS